MYSNSGSKGFKEQAEQWRRQNPNPGGGEVLGAKGMRYDDHSDKAREILERKRRSEKENNPGSSLSK